MMPQHGARAAMKLKAEQPKPLPCRFVKAERLLLEALAAGDLTAVEVCCWLIVRAHCRKNRPKCFPSLRVLGFHLNVSERYASTLLNKLEVKGFLRKTIRPGLTTIYEPLIYGQPPNYRSGVNDMNPRTTDQGLADTHEPQFTTPMNHSSGHPGTTVHTEVEVLKQMKEVEYVQPSADASTSPEKESPKKGRRKLPLIKDPTELEKILATIDLQPYRAEWEPKGVDVNAVWKNLRAYVLTGSASNPGPNPSNWRDFKRALRDSCERQEKYNREHRKQREIAPSPAPKYQDLNHYEYEDIPPC
jgi:hypothetical protein